ncbi:MAG: transcriptional regulator [Haloquadratum sp.]|jgi:ribosome-binding protein aMBF1 (putative translation factor)|nr:transcriptional regulator [Haloferacaceae archaeon]MDR9444732.1 transcriptional regulator [Haloquadratum sp.]
MAKYSTGRGGGGATASACELCGADDARLRAAEIAGAKLMVCAACAPHDDRAAASGGGGGVGTAGESRRKQIARQQAKMIDRSKADGDRWVREGTNYESDALPYLVGGYGERLQAARTDAALSVAELAAMADLEAETVRSVEAGRAISDAVGGSAIRALEEALEITLADE